MTQLQAKRPTLAALYGLGAAVLMAAIASTDGWVSLEERVQGILLLRRGPLAWNPDVLVIDLDEASFRRLGRPLPRKPIARLVEALTAARVRAIAFDIVYDSPSFDGPLADEAFAAAVARSARTVLPVDCYPRWIEPNGTLSPAQVLGEAQTPGAHCTSISLPLAKLRETAMLAHFVYGPSAAGYARYAVPIVSFEGGRLPTLPLAAFAVGQGIGLAGFEQRPRSIQVGDLTVPVDALGLTPVSFRGFPPSASIPLHELIAAIAPTGNRFPEELEKRLAGKYLLVGTSVDSLGDVAALASGEKFPAVAFHAAFLSDLLEHHLVREAPRELQILIAFLSALLLTGAALLLQLWRGVLALAAMSLGALALSLPLSAVGYLVGPLGAVVAGLVAWSATTAARLAIRERQQRVLRDAFGAYVDPTMLERILVDPDRFLSLSGARKTLTVLFTDICGFTALTNRLGAAEVVSLLREYLAEMTRIITLHEGRVDKIMGDGILAVFGDPISYDDHARRALEVCLQMQQAVLRISTRWQTDGGPPLAIRLGVATGDVFVGNIGARDSKLEYTVLGVAVNLASRLETRAPPGAALVSEQTRQAGELHFEFEAVGPMALKGFPGRTPAWVLMGLLPSEQMARKHARHAAPRVPVRLHHGSTQQAAVVTNVSAHGLFVETPLEAAPGTLIEVEFEGQPVRVRARVRRRGKGPEGALGLGLAVEEGNALSPEASHVLASLRVERE